MITMRVMGRWEPDARGRLERAAMELYREQGFEETTVAEIAARAGLTERTFFRHFADKREVLFRGANELEARMVAAVAAAPPGTGPVAAAAAGLDVAAEMIGPGRERARLRAAIIAANAELRERELIKLASLSAAFARTLRERGVSEPAASLSAELVIGVFRVGFERWVQEDEERSLAAIMRESLAEMGALAAGRS
jgi:AcrR family transcriptional regulator